MIKVVISPDSGSHPRYTRGPCSAFYGRTTSAAKGAVRDVSQVERR